MSIGDRIKLLRKANRLSQRALAAKVGVSAMAISKYERDQATPGSDMLVRLSQALNAPVDAFLRPSIAPIRLKAYRKHSRLGAKDREAIQARVQEWLERYTEIESFVVPQCVPWQVLRYDIYTIEDCEEAAKTLRCRWNLGIDPIENVMELLEDQGIKVGMVEGFDCFDACTFIADDRPNIVVNADVSGDRQRFSLCHELGHLVLDIHGDLDHEKAAHRFAGAFLVPGESVKRELGPRRTNLDPRELFLLKHKYGVSMQAWIRRAKDLDIISDPTFTRLCKGFSARGWRRQEPGDPVQQEKPHRMARLVYRALVENIISRSRAQELSEEPIEWTWLSEG